MLMMKYVWAIAALKEKLVRTVKWMKKLMVLYPLKVGVQVKP
jgi:hypothetical protein